MLPPEDDFDDEFPPFDGGDEPPFDDGDEPPLDDGEDPPFDGGDDSESGDDEFDDDSVDDDSDDDDPDVDDEPLFERGGDCWRFGPRMGDVLTSGSKRLDLSRFVLHKMLVPAVRPVLIRIKE